MKDVILKLGGTGAMFDEIKPNGNGAAIKLSVWLLYLFFYEIFKLNKDKKC